MQLDKMNFDGQVNANVVRSRSPEDKLDKLGGKFFIEHYDSEGNLKGKYEMPNGITNAAKNSILGIMFHADTQITTWYIGLIASLAYSALSAGDVMSSHDGWTEFTGYSQSTRVSWGPGAASSQQITNSTPATFDITGTDTNLKGVFINSVSTKSGTTGTLWATAPFAADVPVAAGDQLKITYAVAA